MIFMTPDEHLRLMVGDLVVQLALVKAERDALKNDLNQQNHQAVPDVAPA